MASTAHKTEAEYIERFDPPEELERKIDLLTQWIRASKHFIAFTGAGISTSAGIPDFRSGMNTKLDVGPGVWTIRAEVKKKGKARVPKKRERISTHKAIPTPTHMALVTLQQHNLLKYLISQNTDGLHRRSGFPPGKLSELHGNTNLETCIKCKKDYLRDFRTRNARGCHDHLTGRLCVKCGGNLKDSIINFGENLPEVPLERAEVQSSQADLCLSMGSSLRVTPAANMPEEVGQRENGKLVIVNLQSTPLDDVASLRINAKCDDVMIGVMKRLGLAIPEFRLERRIIVGALLTEKLGKSLLKVRVEGVDSDGTPATFFTCVEIELPERFVHMKRTKFKISREPFRMQARTNKPLEAKTEEVVGVKTHFFGHYKEPPFVFVHKVDKENPRVLYRVVYNPFTGTWGEPVAETLDLDAAIASKLQEMSLSYEAVKA